MTKIILTDTDYTDAHIGYIWTDILVFTDITDYGSSPSVHHIFHKYWSESLHDKMQDKLQGKLYKSEAVSAAKRGKTAKKTLSTS